jgi:hypothetical protein
VVVEVEVLGVVVAQVPYMVNAVADLVQALEVLVVLVLPGPATV